MQRIVSLAFFFTASSTRYGTSISIYKNVDGVFPKYTFTKSGELKSVRAGEVPLSSLI